MTLTWFPREGSTTLTLYLPPGANSGDLTSRSLMPTMLARGSVGVVNYPEFTYDTAAIAEEAAAATVGYQTVVILGGSIGASIGLLVHDAIVRDRPDTNVQMIIACGIICPADSVVPIWLVTRRWMEWMQEYPVYSRLDALFSRLFAVPQDPGVGELVREHRDFICHVPAATKLLQLRYLAGLPETPCRREVDAVYIQAGSLDGNDGLVKSSAVPRMRRAVRTLKVFHRPQLGHCTYLEQAIGWAAVINQSYDYHCVPTCSY